MSTPKGSVHHFSNPGSETARALVMMTPDIGEQYFHDVGAVVNTGGPPDLARLLEVMKQYGLVPAARQASRMAKGCAEDTGRVVALAALVLGAGVGMGTAAGVFDRLGAVELAVLSLFATLYALATYGLDRGVRQFILGQPLRRLAALAAAFDAALVATVCLALPWPPIGLFAGPLALVSNVALVERMLRAWRALPRPGAWSVSNPRMRVIPAAA